MDDRLDGLAAPRRVVAVVVVDGDVVATTGDVGQVGTAVAEPEPQVGVDDLVATGLRRAGVGADGNVDRDDPLALDQRLERPRDGGLGGVVSSEVARRVRERRMADLDGADGFEHRAGLLTVAELRVEHPLPGDGQRRLVVGQMGDDEAAGVRVPACFGEQPRVAAGDQMHVKGVHRVAVTDCEPHVDLRPSRPSAAGERLLETVRSHLDEMQRIAARHGASNLRVFGSAARGDEREGSDIDLLVDLDEDADLFSLVRLERELSELLGVGVDVMPASAVDDEEVLTEAVAP